jgi:hypothetical protein
MRLQPPTHAAADHSARGGLRASAVACMSLARALCVVILSFTNFRALSLGMVHVCKLLLLVRGTAKRWLW